MIRQVLVWIAGRFGKRSVIELRGATLIDRHLWALDFEVGQRDLCDRIRRLELELLHHVQQLQALSDGPVTHARLARLRGEILEYRGDGGVLARALRRWPSADPEVDRRLHSALAEGERLSADAAEIEDVARQLMAARYRLSAADERYGILLPRLWSTSRDYLQERIGLINSRRGVEELASEFDRCEQVLAEHLATIADLERDLLAQQRVHDRASESMLMVAPEDREERIAKLVEIVEIEGRIARERAHTAVDVAVDSHLRHLRVRQPDKSVKAKAIGTVERGIARWRQLKQLELRSRPYV